MLTLLRTVWLACIFLAAVASASAAEWLPALNGWQYEFPRDHGPHEGFKTEWWYFTGDLHDESGRRLGYELTFFRQGIRPPSERGGTTSRFVVDDLKFAHFALTDVGGKRFHFFQKTSRGAFGEAGFSASGKVAWIDDWSLTIEADGAFHLRAASEEMAVDLSCVSGKQWAIHGADGVSQKAAGAGHASHYYSGTRMTTGGSVTLGGRAVAVTGESWFDHEWASNQLAAEQAGWDWFSLQLDDGSELMLYQMRLRDGSIDPVSSGTFIAADGTTRHLSRGDYRLTPVRFWKSKATGANYPIAWRVELPSLALALEVSTPVEAQELDAPPVSYWEGLIEATGTRGGKAVRGHGYLELTGYAGPIVGLGK